MVLEKIGLPVAGQPRFQPSQPFGQVRRIQVAELIVEHLVGGQATHGVIGMRGGEAGQLGVCV